MASDNVGSRLKALDRKALHTTPIISVSWVVGLRKSIRNRVGVGGSERSRGGEDLELREKPFIRRVVLHADQSFRGELFD